MNSWIMLMICGVFISSISQVLLKLSSSEKHKSIIFEYINWKVITGYSLFILAISFSMTALKNGINLKNIPIIESLGYIFIAIFSKLIFKENIRKEKIIGIFIIIIGIVVFYI